MTTLEAGVFPEVVQKYSSQLRDKNYETKSG
jgi:hypothetical protein